MTLHSVVVYFLVLAVFGTAIWATIHVGSGLTGSSQAAPPVSNELVRDTIQEGNPFSIFFAAI
jgi:membrane protein DedA with SNARE-associated domain